MKLYLGDIERDAEVKKTCCMSVQGLMEVVMVDADTNRRASLRKQ